MLDSPAGITFDSSNTALYISESNNHRVQKWIPGASAGTTIAGQNDGISGSTLTRLNSPRDVQVDANENVYIADLYNHRIVMWSHGASIGTMIAGNGMQKKETKTLCMIFFFLGTAGSANNQLNSPPGIALDSKSNILYVADSGNHRIMQYYIGNSSGVVVAGGDGFGLNSTQLCYPVNVYLDSPSNSLFIVNYFGNTIVRWILGASSWTLVAGNINGMSGVTSLLLSGPSTVILDPFGNVYVSDSSNNRIQSFLVDQTNGTTLAGITGVNGSANNLLDNPLGITFDGQLNLYVADSNNQRVQKFSRY